jgi:4-nitrophenyl phosphatase
VGKPEAYIFDIARRLLEGCRRVAVVGDSMDADIVGGKRSGLLTVLVLSGTSSSEQVRAAAVQPDLVLPDLASLATARASSP